MADVPSAAGALFGPSGPDRQLGNKALQPGKEADTGEQPIGIEGQIDEVLASVKGLGAKVRDSLRSALIAKFGSQDFLSTLSKGAAEAPRSMGPMPKAGIPVKPQAMGIRG
jgi:hypothetical protein